MAALNLRKESILNVVVKDYISSAEPVGSATVCRKYLKDLSSATVRGVMSRLVEEGYLEKPHSSAGRIPTDKGYRFYVDSLKPFFPAPEEKDFIQEKLRDTEEEGEDLLQVSLNILSQLTHKTGIILAPRINAIVLKRMELIRLSRSRLLVLVVGGSGETFNRHVQLEENLSQEQLNSISRFLNDRYSGLTLPAIREKVLGEMAHDRRHYDVLLQRAMEICSRFFSQGAPPEGLYFTGIENLFNQRELMNDVAAMREIIKILERKAALVLILDRCMDEEGAGILIGSETGREEIRDCALIAHSYKRGDQTLGTIAVLGHKRMEYQRIISLVNFTAQCLSEKLSGKS